MSKASKAVLVTLTSVFPQCRAFGDGYEINQGPNDITNMVRWPRIFRIHWTES